MTRDGGMLVDQYFDPSNTYPNQKRRSFILAAGDSLLRRNKQSIQNIHYFQSQQKPWQDTDHNNGFLGLPGYRTNPATVSTSDIHLYSNSFEISSSDVNSCTVKDDDSFYTKESSPNENYYLSIMRPDSHLDSSNTIIRPKSAPKKSKDILNNSHHTTGLFQKKVSNKSNDQTIITVASCSGSEIIGGFLQRYNPPAFAFGRSWRKRYFILTSHALHCFKNADADSIALETLPITSDTIICVTDTFPGKSFVIQWTNKKGQSKTWYTQAEKVEDLKVWLHTGKNTVQSTQGPILNGKKSNLRPITAAKSDPLYDISLKVEESDDLDMELLYIQQSARNSLPPPPRPMSPRTRSIEDHSFLTHSLPRHNNRHENNQNQNNQNTVTLSHSNLIISSNQLRSQSSNGLNQSSNGLNQSSNGLNQSSNGLNQSSNGLNQSSNGLNQSSNGLHISNVPILTVNTNIHRSQSADEIRQIRHSYFDSSSSPPSSLVITPNDNDNMEVKTILHRSESNVIISTPDLIDSSKRSQTKSSSNIISMTQITSNEITSIITTSSSDTPSSSTRNSSASSTISPSPSPHIGFEDKRPRSSSVSSSMSSISSRIPHYLTDQGIVTLNPRASLFIPPPPPPTIALPPIPDQQQQQNQSSSISPSLMSTSLHLKHGGIEHNINERIERNNQFQFPTSPISSLSSTTRGILASRGYLSPQHQHQQHQIALAHNDINEHCSVINSNSNDTIKRIPYIGYPKPPPTSSLPPTPTLSPGVSNPILTNRSSRYGSPPTAPPTISLPSIPSVTPVIEDTSDLNNTMRKGHNSRRILSMIGEGQEEE